MAQEDLNVNTDETVVTNESDVEVEATDTSTEQAEAQPKKSKYEDEALDMGWRPESEWEGDPEDFVTAKEFVQRKSFFDKIAAQNAEIKELKATLNKFSEHYKNVENYTRKQVLQDLNAQKQKAYEDGDVAQVAKIDEAIIDFKLNEQNLKQQEEVEAQRKAGQPNPEVAVWQKKNSWYMQDREMTDYVDTFTRGFIATHPDAVENPQAVLDLIDKEVRARFPSKFRNTKREAPAVVESSSNAATKKPAEKLQASAEELATARKFVRMGIYKDTNEYIKELRMLEKGE